MTVNYRRPNEADIAAMAELAAAAQSDPDYHIPYLGLDRASIAVDLGELEGWTAISTVAESGGAVIGWLVADVERDMGRNWWWGPFVSRDIDRSWDDIADGLYRETRPLLAEDVTEEEAIADDRSEPMRRWCARHGFRSDPASVLLRREPTPAPPAPPAPPAEAPTVRRLAEADHEAVRRLHDLAFPGTHTVADALVRSDDPRAVVEVDGSVVGYVAYELQSDGSGYVDYLAVDEARRGQGLGGLLVGHACRDMFAAGAVYAHLTVREENAAARSLYRRLGFEEERIARPYRVGFHLP